MENPIDHVPSSQSSFTYMIEWDNKRLLFQDITGLADQNTGLTTPRITMKEGLFESDINFWGWYDRMRVRRARSTLFISRVNEADTGTSKWVVNHAFPLRVSGKDLCDDGNKVAIELLEFTFQNIEVE